MRSSPRRMSQTAAGWDSTPARAPAMLLQSHNQQRRFDMAVSSDQNINLILREIEKLKKQLDQMERTLSDILQKVRYLK